MSQCETSEIASLPATYFLPRDGKFTRATAFDPDHLRLVRTELELLRRIRRRASLWRTPGWAGGVAHHTQSDREELAQILRDARHPAVEEMAELLDKEFAAIREEIVMSAVNDESENIVQEAAEAGVLQTEQPDAEVPTAPESIEGSVDQARPDTPSADMAEVDEAQVLDVPSTEAARASGVISDDANTGGLASALNQAEDALDEAVELCREGLGDATESVEADASGNADASDTASETVNEMDAALEATHDLGLAVDAVNPSDDATPNPTPQGGDAPDEDLAATESATDAETTEVIVDAEAASDDTSEQALDGQDGCDAPLSNGSETPADPSQRAEEAIDTIEHGIRRIATTLREQVAEQWDEAKQALRHVTESGTLVADARGQVEALLEEIGRLRDDARAVVDELNKTRTQARLFREDARRARERAEASAVSAEQAADQAAREATNAAHPAGAD